MRLRRRTKPVLLLALIVGLLAFGAAACGGGDEDGGGETTEAPATEDGGAGGAALSGSIEIDGSSTVAPLVTAGVEAFTAENPDVVATVGSSGTGGGFERFCVGETDISNASRPIKEDEPPRLPPAENGVEYVEPGRDRRAHRRRERGERLGAASRRRSTRSAPESEGTITNWNQVDPSFPDEPLLLGGPGADSGTFDYFTEAVNGEEGASRADYTATEDDNVTVQLVSEEKGGLGYFGYSYYEENQDRLKAVEIDSGGGCVAPSAETAADGTYTPLSRPLFVYPKLESLARPEVAAFVQYLLDNNAAIAETALFIPLNETQLADSEAALAGALG
jgi:phosphate transport system substrate-binding protein